MATSSTWLTSLTGLLTSIGSTPGGLGLFHRGMSSSQELQAVQVIDNMMLAGPAAAAAFMPQLAMLNLPPQVMSQINDAISDPTSFKQMLSSAKTALLTAGAGGISSLLGGL